MQKTVLSFGEALWDLFPSGPALGGAPFNFACRVNSLGDRGIIISRIGRDDYGRKALEQIAAFGMDVSCLQREDRHPTGTVKVRLDDQGNPDFLIVPEVAYDFIGVTEELLELARAADCLCFGTLVQRAPTSRDRQGREVSGYQSAQGLLFQGDHHRVAQAGEHFEDEFAGGALPGRAV